MTKLSQMNIPKPKNQGGKGMYYCQWCKSWVPSKEKHILKTKHPENEVTQ